MKGPISPSTFCILPWIHLYIDPVGDVFPCCVREPSAKPFGSIKTSSIEDVWNSDRFREFRKDILTGKARNDICRECYSREKLEGWSHRSQFNSDFKHHVQRVDETKDDGAVEKSAAVYIDFRLSNICNFKCRSCGPESSTSWASDYRALGLPPVKEGHSGMDRQKILTHYLKHLETAERVYFAGGEPLLMSEHYELLSRLSELERFEVQLDYNTNLSQLKIGRHDVVPYWKKFHRVNVWPSIDQTRKKAEYVRKGTDWGQILKNIRRLRDEVPHVSISPSITVSIYNVLDLDSIVEELRQCELIPKHEPNSFSFNILREPTHLHVSTLSSKLKAQAEKTLHAAIEKYRDLPCVAGRYEHVLEHVLRQPEADQRSTFITRTQALDSLRKEDFFKLYPEMEELKLASLE